MLISYAELGLDSTTKSAITNLAKKIGIKVSKKEVKMLQINKALSTRTSNCFKVEQYKKMLDYAIEMNSKNKIAYNRKYIKMFENAYRLAKEIT